jgi:hypothetical protein
MRSPRKKKARAKSEKVLLPHLRRNLDGADADRGGGKRSNSRLELYDGANTLPGMPSGGNGGEAMTTEQKNTVLATLRRLSQSASEVEITSRRIAEALEVMRQKLEATQ